jgi:hypothetical protein
MKKIIIITIVVLVSLISFSCIPFLEMQLTGTWYAGIDDNVRLTIESDKTFLVEVYDDDEGVWNDLVEGDGFTLTNDTIKYDITHMDMFSGIEPVEQPYSFMSTYLLDGDTFVTMTHPLYLLVGYIMKGGNTDTLIGTWISDLEFVQTEDGTTETGTAEVSFTLNNDDTYSLEIEEDGTTDTETGTYSIDTSAKEITLTPDDATESYIMPYKVTLGGLLLGNAISTPDNFEVLIFVKE